MSFLVMIALNVPPRHRQPNEQSTQQSFSTNDEPSLQEENDEEASVSTTSSDGAVSNTEGQEMNERVQSMIDYFEALSSEEEGDALAIILDNIRHNENGRAISQGEDDLFSRSNATLRKKIMSLLATRVPEEHRQKRFGDKTLEKWLESNNQYRSFMFTTKQQLVQIAASSAGVRVASTLSFDAIIEKLVSLFMPSPSNQEDDSIDDESTSSSTSSTNSPSATTSNQTAARATTNSTYLPENHPQAVTIKQEVIKAMLQKSFMRPLKGASKEHCELGHKLELPIGLDWMRDVNEKKLFPGFTVISLHKAGLVGKKNQPWAKDSIDFLAFVLDESNSDSALQLWGIEIKSRQTCTTINEEKDLNRKLRRKKYELIQSSEVFKFIPKASERFQLLHHAYVYDFDRVAIIIGNGSGKVISGTAINIDFNLQKSYGKVVEDLKNIALLWAYSPLPACNTVIPSDVMRISKDVPTINGKEALYGAFKLWKTMFVDPGPGALPYPVLKRIIPSTHAHWNSTKGGSDTVTKIADDCIINPPRQQTNFETTATSRCISNLLVAIFKCYQASTSSSTHQYPSLDHYRNAASSRVTFKRFLRMIYKIMESRVKGEITTTSASNGDDNDATARPRRQRFQGTVPEQMDFAPAQTFKTPKKAKKKQVDRGAAAAEVIQRVHQCTGYPFEVVCQKTNHNNGAKKDPRRKCYVCKTKTKWQCIKCRFYFCMAYEETSTRNEQLYYTSEKENQDSNRNITRIFGKSCFHKAHESAIREALTDQTNTTTES